MKSGSLKLLETSGPVQGCKGIALPLPFYFYGLECKNDDENLAVIVGDNIKKYADLYSIKM
jgi:hypothetical protein